jgi:hypothetical protein
MNFFGLSLDRLDGAVPFLIVISLVVMTGHVLFQRVIGPHYTHKIQESVGHYFAVVSTIYAVTLGLVVFDALGSYQAANDIVSKEAKSLLAVYSLAERFPEEDQKDVQLLIQNYVDAVIQSEWSQMADRKECPLSRGLMFELMIRINHLNATTPPQLAVLPLIHSEMINAMAYAKMRLQRNEDGIPALEWSVLFLGAFITILFSWFIESKGFMHVLMTSMVAIVIGANLILVLAFGEPFKGGFQVSSEQFVILKDNMAVMAKY